MLWEIECITFTNKVTGVVRYTINVVMTTVPWRDVVSTFSTYNKDEANKEFQRLVHKYKELN